ncbi:MAG TPA: hypothetical protein VNZ22_03605, partial [Bacillota bacterium]|nr:hypothetical protein [Bacillota bacterium]
DVDRIYIGRADPTGVPNINRNTGWLYLAKTNRVRVSSSTANPSNTGIEVGRSGSNNGNGSRLYLGQTNEIYAASLGIGLEKETGCQMLFNPLFTDPALYLRGADGSSRMSLWTVGDGESNSGTTSCQGTCDLSGGSVNALVDVMTVGRASSNTSGTGGSRGTLTFDRGTLDINTLQVGLQTVNTGKNGDGTVNVRNNAMLIVNTSLQLGQATGGAGAATTVGRLNIDGGTVQAYAIATTNISGNGRGSFITLVNGGTLVLTTTGGSALSALSDFSISDSTLTIFFPDQGTTNLMVDNLTPGGNGNTLTVGFLPGITSYPATFPLISYTNLLSGLNFTASLPAGYTGSIVNDSARRLVSLVISSGPVPKAISWRGTPTGNWNTSDLNWLASGSPSAYAQGDFVTFDDTASGTTTVNLPAPLMPGSLTINNSTKTYTFTGNGRFSGFFDLIKQGAGTLILDTVGVNDFVGDIAIANGTVQVGNADGNGNLNGGAISLAAGSTLAFNKATALTVANGISGSGHLNQNGSAAV